MVLMLENLIKITRRPVYVSFAAFHIYVDQIEFSSRGAGGIIRRTVQRRVFLVSQHSMYYDSGLLKVFRTIEPWCIQIQRFWF